MAPAPSVTERENPIDNASLFSAPEPVLHNPVTESRPPATNPFQAPDFEDDAHEDAHEDEGREASGPTGESASPAPAADERMSDPFAPAE